MLRAPKNSILLICPAGLGNRISVIQSGVLLGRAINKRVYFEWVRDANLGCDYEDLFKPPKEFSLCDELPVSRGIKTDWIRELNTNTRYSALNSVLKKFKGGIRRSKEAMYSLAVTMRFQWLHDGVYTPEGPKTDLPCERTLQGKKRILINARTRFYPFDPSGTKMYKLNYMEPTDELQNRIDAISKQFTDKTVGVHIRRGDVSPTRNSGWYVSDEIYIRRMEEEIAEDKDRNFYLATHSDETREQFKNHFGERVMLQPKHDYSRDGATGMKCAVVDLFSLAKTTRIIRGASSFGAMASAIGGIESTQFEKDGTIRHVEVVNTFENAR